MIIFNFFEAMTMGKLIVKSNKLIEAKYRLPLTEMRLVLKLASVIEREDEDFKDYTFQVGSLLNEFDIGNDNYNEIKKATSGLIERVLKIQEPDGLLQISFLSSAKYIENKGTVKLCFDPKLKPYLMQLKENFTVYQFDNIKRLKRTYAIRFYELLKQYQTIGTRKFQLDELRDILGIGKEEYQRYNDFKRYAILPAQKELKAKTDISFEFKENKVKRKVTEIIFVIKSNKVDYKKLDRIKTLKKQAKSLARESPVQQPLF